MKKEQPAFWVTNASLLNVTLSDLALNIKAFTTVNLLDKKHYNYTMEQLLKSKTSGSLFKKRDKILVRNLPPPDPQKNRIPIVESSVIPSRQRSLFQINQVEYEELKVADDKEREKELQKKLDEEYARENADLAEADDQRVAVFSKKG